MSVWEAIAIGAVQGLTEFLPVSSSGHIVLLERFFGIGTPSLVFHTVLHAGTALAVCIIFMKDYLYLAVRPFSRLGMLIGLTVTATSVLALIMKYFFYEAVMGSVVGLGFIFTAVFLLVIQFMKIKEKPFDPKIMHYDDVTMGEALFLGVTQGIAVLPGISRSGMTIASGMVIGMNRTTVSKYSFFCSVPVIFGACVFEIIGADLALNMELVSIFAGFVSAFVFGLLSIKFMLKLVQGKMFYPFSIYLVVVAILSFFI